MGAATRTAIIERTRQWVRETFLYMRPDWPLTDDTPLLKGGVVDSVGVIELVAWLEATFQLSIPEGDITEAHFGTLADIGDYVEARARDPKAGANAWPAHVA